MSELSDDLFEDGDEGDNLTEDSDLDGESESEKGPKSTDKRVSDLQSKADKETARANKAETRLKALEDAMKDNDTEDRSPSATPGGSYTDTVVLDMARMFAFQQNPKLAEYGLAASDLNGDTPSEVARVAAELVTRYEKIETQVRNKVLASQGLAPEIEAGSPPKGSRDFSNMSSEDFKKVMDAAMNKR